MSFIATLRGTGPLAHLVEHHICNVGVTGSNPVRSTTDMSYYRNFKVVLSSEIFKRYLLWAYGKGIEDLAKLNFRPNFNQIDFSCLLCGVGNEGTADLFIKFVTERNPRAKIWIVDLGQEQIAAVNTLVKEKYPDLDIVVKRINALDLQTLIPNESLDWIETDGFLEYFDSPDLERLFSIWRLLLKPSGFITTRDFSTGNGIAAVSDAFRVWLAKRWLGVSLFRHTKDEYARLFKQFNFKSAEGLTPLPTYKRFSIVKQNAD